ncbi:unnamed protein product [Macrosiphum euphorbiae]|uniref:THAP-type domain-containing protein n=1 Tax=Macrosiphum euphorbiae TaxID=13131 RepID=A0AAV0W9F0_9HEMI|nr:unnamed protein product [Macrosiphum euphorbiae]
MANNKPRGGSSCAVATCTNYSGKVKTSGRKDLSFHRFPKDDILAKKWQHLCRRGDVWNSKTAYICSDHFTNNDFVRDLKAELLEYEPKKQYLKNNVLPSLNLPLDHSQKSSIRVFVKPSKSNECKR